VGITNYNEVSGYDEGFEMNENKRKKTDSSGTLFWRIKWLFLKQKFQKGLLSILT